MMLFLFAFAVHELTQPVTAMMEKLIKNAPEEQLLLLRDLAKHRKTAAKK